MIAWRDAAPADAAALAALFADSFTETFGHLYHPDDLAAFLAASTADRWAGELSDPAFAVRLGAVEGRALAFAKLGPRSLPCEPMLPAIELRQFYLLRPLHGTGAAQTLMAWVLDEARRRGAGELVLSVYVDNHRARRFYARYGFERIGRYTFMVGNHADEDHIMRLVL